MCPVTDAATGETRDVDLLQELILTNGLIDCDWFSLNPKRRLRTWLPPERRLALRQWQAGDIVEVCGLKSAPELNGKMAVVKAYLPQQRRFQCELVVVVERGKQPPQQRKGKKKKKKPKKPKPIALRAENLVVRFGKAWPAGVRHPQTGGVGSLTHKAVQRLLPGGDIIRQLKQGEEEVSAAGEGAAEKGQEPCAYESGAG